MKAKVTAGHFGLFFLSILALIAGLAIGGAVLVGIMSMMGNA